MTTIFASEIAMQLLVLILTWMRTYKLNKLAANADIKIGLPLLILQDGWYFRCGSLCHDLICHPGSIYFGYSTFG